MSANLLQLLDRMEGAPVLLLGDLMLDRYLWGEVSRISPEAPVPVLKVVREDRRLGGAGSVLANLSALGAQVHAVAVLGDDPAGDRTRELLDALPGVDASGVLTSGAVHTTQKTRLIARAQQLMRIDRDAEGVPDDVADQLRDAALERLDLVKAVLVSDYARGVLTDDLCRVVFSAARERGIPVLVDPHPNSPFERFSGASTMTPNRSETARALDLLPQDPASILQAAQQLIERYDLEWVALTLDKDGIYGLRKGEAEGELYPAKARSVFDVAGAGDMVLTVLGLAAAAGADQGDALRMANVAAGWEVEHLGVVPLPREELAVELSSSQPPELRRKVVDDWDDAAERLRRARLEGKTIVFTNGCFDLLHAGHVHFIQGCRAKGDYLVVGLNTDESISGLKGSDRPVLPLFERATVLAGMEAVDIVVPFADETPINLITKLKPEILCKGEDYRDKVVVGRELVEGYGGRVELVELLPGRSTSNIIKRITGQED
jgi:D-beta-D-heptose 7-phosphate kinase/D-beta-D-heptose 1-phosphate adenosyltransferase